VTLIINDRVDIALTIEADGVHLGQDDLPADKAREILGDSAIIGLSTHNLEQAIAASKQPVDYIAIGPVFPTTSKADPDEVIGLDLLRRVRDALPAARLVAIGGINDENITDVLAAGADSAAGRSALLRELSEISARFRGHSALTTDNIVLRCIK